jgi:hypothetical protein
VYLPRLIKTDRDEAETRAHRLRGSARSLARSVQ